MIKALKAKWRKDTVLTKLNYLKKEWLEGRATQTDVPHWENNLKEFKDVIVPHINELQEELASYERIYDMLQYELKTKELATTSKPMLIFAGLVGGITFLKTGIANQKQPGDVVIVLGDFIDKDKAPAVALHEIMALALDEGVVFVISQDEKEELLKEEWTDVERAFIERLPLTVDTEDFAFFADKVGDGMFRLDRVLDGNIPNLSQKLFIYRSDMKYSHGYRMNERKRVMALNQGLLIRLDVRESGEE